MLMHTRVYIEKKLCTLESAQTSSLCVTDRRHDFFKRETNEEEEEDDDDDDENDDGL